MNKVNIILILTLLTFSIFGFSQESLEPLKTNLLIIKKNSFKDKNSSNNNNYIFLEDTLDIPVIDDFSTNKFMIYDVDSSNNILDTLWYALFDINNNLIMDGSTYMLNPTFKYIYDSSEVNGLDTLLITSIQNSSDSLIIFNLNSYPIQVDTVLAWPNITFVDSTWTVDDPDLSFSSDSPDLFQDSIRLFFVEPSESENNNIWVDDDVYLNDNFPINPWTLGVVTFDGINSKGYPYDWTSPTAVGWADHLTSKPIFLSNKTISDSLYISFFYQCGGNGEKPDLDDSLVLEFYIPSLEQWKYIWSTNGIENDNWLYKHIPLENIYFEDGFRFRFKNYGSLAGGLDHWNLDYIYFDENRSINDTLMNDWAFTSPPLTVLENYTSIPWSHYKKMESNYILNNITIPTFNSSESSKLLQPCSMDILFKDSIFESIPYAATILNVPELSYFDMVYNTTDKYQFDTTVLDTFASFDVRFNLSTNTTPERLSENDTIYLQQNFHNYYSYDDGSAESAYGLVGNGVELAYKFELSEEISSDTLRAINIHFSPSVNDVSSEGFFIQIWADNEGLPGEIIYTSDDQDLPEIFYPQYNTGINGFYEYELPVLVPVSGVYYIGWKQASAERLNIGFDENINKQENIFYNMGSGFENTIFEGALMMRPVFISEMDGVLNLPILNRKQNDIKIYPNPASSDLYLENENMNFLRVFDISGRIVMQRHINGLNTISVESFKEGVYIFQITLESGDTINKKIIISH